MVDRNFTDLDGKHSTIVGGNFFKYDANYNNIDSSNSIDNSDIDSSDSVDNSDIDSSISIDNSNIDLTADANKGSGLSQREKTILAVCISVGGAIIITFIVFYVWRRRWRNSNLADPTYQDVIETEIGGATVPADNAPALLQGTVDNEHNNVATRQGEQPPTYNDVVVERRQTLLASTEKPDMKKDDD
ncbi:hypothetical protein GGH96_005429 [Coemansia sp. RSA 1972]|nr:hypothetical protein GGH96_005429 [Coemansia sp. RSA 1972]